jgi:hypothetical protein
MDNDIDFIIKKKIKEERKNYFNAKNMLPPPGYIERLVKEEVSYIRSIVLSEEDLITQIEDVRNLFKKDDGKPIKL